jgi:hypothetical protein
MFEIQKGEGRGKAREEKENYREDGKVGREEQKGMMCVREGMLDRWGRVWRRWISDLAVAWTTGGGGPDAWRTNGKW